MPVCNLASLGALAQQLLAAAAQQDWQRMAQLDRVLAAWLQAQHHMTPAAVHGELQLAWQQVHQAHQEALQACQHAKAEVGAQLQQLQQSQEAQQAYAWQEVLK